MNQNKTENEEGLKLVYVNPIGRNAIGEYEYDFFFAKEPSLVWGENWDEPFALFGGDMKPYKYSYDEIRRVVVDIPFACAQQNSCFSMKHCFEGCVALCYEDINDYDEYPEPYRIVFQYGEDIDSVTEKLSSRDKDSQE